VVSNDADATGSGGAGGRDGGTGGADAGTGGAGDSGTDRSGDAANLACMEVALLRLSELKVNSTAAPGGTAELQVTVANTAGRFISYAGAVLECDEIGTLVIDTASNWLFGIGAGDKSNYVYAVRIAPSAPSGATIHCTARAATIAAQHCPDAESLRTEFKVN
jgi:hypothetical protein